MNTRADIVASLQKASSLAEQAALVADLDAFDAHQRRVAAEQRSVDLADATIRDTLTPVRVHEMHTASTDWLGQVEASSNQNELLAEAALWYGRVSPEVKADPDEFMEQARGMMHRHASAYGEQAQAYYSSGMEYLAFLHRREAASGLPQIDQTVAPDGVTSQPTAIPPDTFDNFAPEVNMDNQAVVGTETSERNPLLQEIQSEDGGQNSAYRDNRDWEAPNQRTPDDAAPNEEATADDVGDSEYNQFKASVAINHTMNMDEFAALQAREAASGLDQIEQTTAPDGTTYKPTDLPGDVMFPWTLPGEENPQADNEAPAQAAIEQVKQAAMDERPPGSCVSCGEDIKGTGAVKCTNCGVTNLRQEKVPTGAEHKLSRKDADAPFEGGVTKTADMFGNSDTPHAVPGQNVANNPATTPHPKDSVDDGHEDASIGNAPTVSDGREYPGYGRGYAEGVPAGEKSVPSAVGGDNGLGIGNPKTGASVCVPCSNNTHQECSGGTCHCVAGGCGGKTASLTPRTSALFVSVAAAENPEFRKAYAYARRWTPGTPLVKRGSAEFESGLYAGISDNPAQQSAWTKAHRKWANKGEQYFATRVQLHSTFTRKVASKFSKEIDGGYLKSEAATTTDLDTLDPASSPAADGSTPLNGIGQPGPLEGGQDAAAPGGPAPYNGAEPMGSPVVPNGRQAASGDPKDFLVNDIPGGPLDGNARAYAFRRRVQANLLATTKS